MTAQVEGFWGGEQGPELLTPGQYPVISHLHIRPADGAEFLDPETADAYRSRASDDGGKTWRTYDLSHVEVILHGRVSPESA